MLFNTNMSLNHHGGLHESAYKTSGQQEKYGHKKLLITTHRPCWCLLRSGHELDQLAPQYLLSISGLLINCYCFVQLILTRKRKTVHSIDLIRETILETHQISQLCLVRLQLHRSKMGISDLQVFVAKHLLEKLFTAFIVYLLNQKHALPWIKTYNASTAAIMCSSLHIFVPFWHWIC